ncbi:MAG: replication-associated recombination protein A [Candidatus Limnocylindrales bacterium]|jgi:putative ATPase
MATRRQTTRPAGESVGQQPAFVPPAGRQPLAARMRPRTLDEVVGHEKLIGERGTLRRALEGGHLGSLLFWGPPGSGKTSLARVLADAAGARLVTISAVMSGVAEVRAIVAEARDRLALNGQPTILFIDEIHRFNKAQQDALLPHVEDGTVTLAGATTENPYFEVNSALLSRLRVYRLEPLTDDEVGVVVRRALADAERGLAGDLGPAGGVALAGEPFEHLVGISAGDARQALNVLEGAVSIADSEGTRDAEGRVAPRLADVEAAAQQRALAYDRAGDGHYDTVSAFIKSIRGNDADAALYWLASMIAAGEDPRFIARRLIILASEDVGLADPRGLEVAVAAAQALDWVGLPEAQYALAQATVMLAVTAKSNAVGRAYFAAMADVLAKGSLAVPAHLRSSGAGRRTYLYPHDFEGDDVDQQYLPDALAGRRYYFPGDQGAEVRIGDRLERQAAARGEPRRRKKPVAGQPSSDPMATGSEGMRRRAQSLSEIAEEQRGDSGE